MKNDENPLTSWVRNPNPPEPKTVKNAAQIVAVRLYGAACEKAGRLAGMAMVEKNKGKKAQLWRAHYEAVKVKEARFESVTFK